jgi:hypothetical protein
LCVRRRAENLLLIILSLVVDDVEEAELVNTLGGGNDTEPVTELLLLEELLGTGTVSVCASQLWLLQPRQPAGEYSQVLEVSSGELLVGDDLDLALTLLGDLDNVAEVSGAAVNLDLVLEELLEGRDVEDLVRRRLGGVDDELLGNLGLLALRGFL